MLSVHVGARRKIVSFQRCPSLFLEHIKAETHGSPFRSSNAYKCAGACGILLLVTNRCFNLPKSAFQLVMSMPLQNGRRDVTCSPLLQNHITRHAWTSPRHCERYKSTSSALSFLPQPTSRFSLKDRETSEHVCSS